MYPMFSRDPAIGPLTLKPMPGRTPSTWTRTKNMILLTDIDGEELKYFKPVQHAQTAARIHARARRST